MQGPDHDHMPPADQDKIKGEKSNNRRAMVPKPRAIRPNGKQIKAQQEAQHGRQHNALQPNPQGQIISDEHFWRHDHGLYALSHYLNMRQFNLCALPLGS